MSTVAEIIEAVRKLTDGEKDEFLEKLKSVDFEDEWDRRMDADAKSGKLDFLIQEAEEATRDKSLREWPGGPRT